MSARTVPSIPPRPTRSPKTVQNSNPSSGVPKIPPRPNRKAERSSSQTKDKDTQSPLNEAPGHPVTHETNPLNPSDRSPSVSLPSVGQEGVESAGLEDEERERVQQPAETRNVTDDLQLHAPIPSVPSSSAEQQVRTVTGTTSRQAAAVGIGTAISPGPVESECADRTTGPRANESIRRSSAASNDRQRESLQLADDEHGIPEVGKSMQPDDKFEEARYESHPNELVCEEKAQCGSNNDSAPPERTVSGDELNDVVRSSANNGAGQGTAPEFIRSPEEELGEKSGEELASRFDSSSRLQEKSLLHQENNPRPISQTEKETGNTGHEEGEARIDEPLYHKHHPDGFVPALGDQMPRCVDEAEDEEDNEDDAPADEVDSGVKHDELAISPTSERKTGDVGPDMDIAGHSLPDRPTSTSTSRRVFKQPDDSLSPERFAPKGEDNEEKISEDGEKYTPVLSDDDVKTPETPLKPSPEEPLHKFTSKDVWEDAPDSSQLEATAITSDIPKEPRGESVSETMEQDLDPSELVKPKETSQVTPSHLPDTEAAETTKHRSTSGDAQEDAQENHQLVAPVQEPKAENKTTPSDVPAKPSIPARPAKRTAQFPTGGEQTKVTFPPSEARKAPPAPGGKPQIPARPLRSVRRDSGEEPLTKTTSTSSAESETKPTTKPKPPVPVRPAGPKISSLKTGFLSDLNDRLKLGPKPPPTPEKKDEPEPPAERGPLSDARKGRARGPARRKPPAAKAPEQIAKTAQTAIPEIRHVSPWNVWSIAEDGALAVGEGAAKATKSPDGVDGVDSAPATATGIQSGNEVTSEPAPQPASGEDEDMDEKTVQQTTSGDDEDIQVSEPKSVSPDVEPSGAEAQQNTLQEAVAETEADANVKLEPEIQQSPSEEELREPQSSTAAVSQDPDTDPRKGLKETTSADEDDDKAATSIP